MSLITNYAVVKLMSGKMKPLKTKVIGNIMSWLLIAIMLVVSVYELYYSFIYGDLPNMLLGAFCIYCTGYLFYVFPGMQNPKNYEIHYASETSLKDGFSMYYKGNPVKIRYVLDKKGHFAFADEKNKHKCVSYANGKKMKNATKYRIVNYIATYFMSMGLLSDNTTITFE